MAESQELFVYDTPILKALTNAMSAARFSHYLARAGGNPTFAMRLYLWNCRLSKALLFPLSMAEVCTRNAIQMHMESLHGAEWLLHPPFTLTTGSRDSLERSLDRLKRQKPQFLPDDLVAALSFDFWSNLFRSEYDHIWSDASLRHVFPMLCNGYGRREVQRSMKVVNELRNRIAHHEPIHADTGLDQKHEEILQVLRWRCPETARWTRKHSTVAATWRNPPTAHSTLPGKALTQANLRPPVVLSKDECLIAAMPQVAAARPEVALVLDSTANLGYRLLPSERILSFVAAVATQCGGMLDLADHTIADVLASFDEIQLASIRLTETTGDVLARFFPSKTKDAMRPRALLVFGGSDGAQVVGIIMHPRIRY